MMMEYRIMLQIYDVDAGETTVYRKLTFWEFLTTFLLALIVGGTIYGVIKAKYHLKWGTEVNMISINQAASTLRQRKTVLLIRW